MKASFTADTIVIREDEATLRIIYLNPDFTVKTDKYFHIEDASVESITLSCSNLFVKSNDGFYYE
jgi:hypothetical protein